MGEIRRDIDEIDAELVRLLNRRAELAKRIGALKGKDGQPFFTPERERDIFDKLDQTNPGPLPTAGLAAIFREIISAARAAEKPLTAAYWGPPGTYTHAAATRIFGESSNFTPVDRIDDVFQTVEYGKADYGVVPLENSIAGVVPETLDRLAHTELKICAEAFLPIHHCLLSRAASLDEIDRVYAGPQPEQQCRAWLRLHLPKAEIRSVAPTVKAVEAAESDPNGAAIANALAAELRGMPILAERIEDNPHNETRFLVVGRNEPARTGRDKTSLLFRLGDRPGELYQALGAFSQFGVNLMMIESRRAQGFDYHFFLDAVGHRTDEAVRNALDALRTLTRDITILGSYPRARD